MATNFHGRTFDNALGFALTGDDGGWMVEVAWHTDDDVGPGLVIRLGRERLTIDRHGFERDTISGVAMREDALAERSATRQG